MIARGGGGGGGAVIFLISLSKNRRAKFAYKTIGVERNLNSTALCFTKKIRSAGNCFVFCTAWLYESQ